MNEAATLLASLDDERLPAMRAMLGPEAVPMLDAAVAAAGGRVFSARPAQITWRPGRSLAITYDARVGWGDKRREPESIVAVTGKSLPEGAVVLARGEEQVAVWRMQNDPQLPGLASVLDASGARVLLDQIEVGPGAVHSRVRAYRPMRRAVVELTTKRQQLFAKIVRPSEVPALQARHRLMSANLPVPPSHGWSEEAGLVVLRAMPGITLRSTLADARSRLPLPSHLAAMLDNILDAGDARRAFSPLDLADDHAELLSRVVPDMAPRIHAIREAVGRCARSSRLVPVHGDFHEAQVLVQQGAITGVLDVDTAAMGERSDDWATLLGHLATWQDSLHPNAADRVRRYARELLAIAEQQDRDHAGLRLRIAAVALGMATGPFRVQTPAWPNDTRRRIVIAEQWIESAAAIVNERALTRVS
jgi:hypothetical protein